ncbi:MAG: hypothetical protein JHD16_10170 [Solirubrobacteraceae bacterium]|nr:hypothetical protein [Solirubrobacteraceae bacterium]
MPRITPDNQLTLSVEALSGAHFQAGDDVQVVPDGRGRLIVERRRADRRSVARGTPDRRTLSGLGDGVYPRDYLTGLRIPGTGTESNAA